MDTMTTGLSGLVTTTEAGRLLGVSPNAILQRIRRYDVPVLRVGKSVLVSLHDLRRTYPEPPRVVSARGEGAEGAATWTTR